MASPPKPYELAAAGLSPHLPGIGEPARPVFGGTGFGGYGRGGMGYGYGGGMGYGYGGMDYGGGGIGYGYGGFNNSGGGDLSALGQHVQVWLAAVQSFVNSVATFSNLLNATFSATALSVTAVADVNRCLDQLRSAAYNALSSSLCRGYNTGGLLRVHRNPGGLPWYVWLLLVYTLLRFVRALIRRMRLLPAPCVPGPSPVPVG